MSRIWLFLHFLGFTMWLGGALAVMVAGVAMKRMDRSLWGGVVDTQAAVYRTLIGPGALLVVLTGIIMTLHMYSGMVGGQAGPWLGTMQGAGILGALVMLIGAMPLALRLSRLEPLGEQAALFDALRKRLALVSSIGGTLALIALLAAAFYRRA